MSDDLDPSRAIASAAFDDEATSDERAAVAASAALQAEVSFYGELHDELAAVEVPAAARESAIAAALGIFDAEIAQAPAPMESSPAVVSLTARRERQRQRQYRWLGGLAAAAAVGVVAVGVVSNGAGTDEQTSTATAATFASAEKSTGDVESAGDAAPSATAAAPADPEILADASASAEAADGAATGGAVGIDPFIGAPAIDSEAALLAFARDLMLPPAPVAATPADDGGLDQEATEATVAETVEAATAETTPATTTDAAENPQLPPSTVAMYSTTAGLPCTSATGPAAAVVYRGQRVIVERDDTAGTVSLYAVETCVLLETLAIGS